MTPAHKEAKQEIEYLRKELEKMRTRQTWVLEDHLCRSCGGRILLCVTGNGMTPGGNAIRKCADCGKATTEMGPDSLCWCGHSHKLNHNATAYRCVSYAILEAKPELLNAFLACGCDPKRGGEVGIVLDKDFRESYK